MSEIYNKNAREAQLMAEAYTNIYKEDKMHTFGNIQFEPLGKDHNGAEAFRVYKDGSYVLYATMFGPRNTVTLYTDPKEYAGPATAHLYPAGPADSLALTEFDMKQIPGGLEQVAARLGASEDAEYESEAEAYRDMSDNYKAEDHAKGVKMALEALEMFKDELHIEGHPEDINVNEVADAHEQLVRALKIIFDKEDVDYITGGRDRQFGEEAMGARFEDMRDYEEHGN